MSATITVNSEVAGIIPDVYVGQVLSYDELAARITTSDPVLLEYSVARQSWSPVGNDAMQRLNTIVSWFAGSCSVPLQTTATDLIAQFNRLNFLTNVYLSFCEICALLLLAADRYRQSPDPNGSGVQHTVTPRVSVRSWIDSHNEDDTECGNLVVVNDAVRYCNLPSDLTVPANAWSTYQGPRSGNLYARYVLLGGEEPPIYYENGILANADRFSVEGVPSQCFVMPRRTDIAGSMSATHNAGAHVISTPSGDISYGASMHKVWILAMETGGVDIPGNMSRFYAMGPPRVAQPGSKISGYIDLRNPAYSADDGGFHVDVYQRTVTPSSAGTVTSGLSSLQWHGLYQDDAQYTPGIMYTVDVISAPTTVLRSGASGPSDSTDMYERPKGSTSVYTRTGNVSVSVVSSTPDSQYAAITRDLITVNDVLDVDVFNLPDYTSDVVHYTDVIQAFERIVSVDDPYLRFCASLTSLYVSAQILESLSLSLTFGTPMKVTFGVGDTSRCIRYVTDDGQVQQLTPAEARQSPDLDAIVAQYVSLGYDVRDRMLLSSAITDAQNAYESISTAIATLADNITASLESALYQAIDPYAAKQALLDVTYAEVAGAEAVKDVVSSAIAAGATSAADVMAYIDRYAPEFSIAMTGEPAMQLRALLRESTYEGYDEYFTNDSPPATYGSAVPFFSKTGAGLIRSDTEGEVLDAKVGALCIWPPVFQTTVRLPPDLMSHLRQQVGDKTITVPLRSSYIVVKPRPESSGNVASLVWLARFSGGGDQAFVQAIEASAEEFRSTAEAMVRAINDDDTVNITVNGWSFDTDSAYDPSTRDLENAMAALTYAGSGALVGSVAGAKGAAAGAAIGTLVGVTAAAFSGSDGTEDDVWDVSKARSIISESMSGMQIHSTSPTPSINISDPREALATMAALYVYAIYRGLWLPITTPSAGDPVGYALITEAMPTPRFFQIAPTTDSVPMALTIASVLTVAGVAMYRKPTKVRIKREKMRKKSDGTLRDAESGIASLSFGSVRARACIPSEIYSASLGMVAGAVTGIRASVKARAARSEQRKLFSTVSSDEATDREMAQYVRDDLVPGQEELLALTRSVQQRVDDIFNSLNRDTRTYYV